jgi:predicted RNase H-like nuclease (RuvC/YqgF family)
MEKSGATKKVEDSAVSININPEEGTMTESTAPLTNELSIADLEKELAKFQSENAELRTKVDDLNKKVAATKKDKKEIRAYKDAIPYAVLEQKEEFTEENILPVILRISKEKNPVLDGHNVAADLVAFFIPWTLKVLVVMGDLEKTEKGYKVIPRK